MSVVVVGTLDTKGEEIAYTKNILEAEGLDVHLIDVGIMGDPEIDPDTDAAAVATAGGASLRELRDRGDRGHAVEVMGDGAAALVAQRYERGEVDGILGLGGSGNTSIATAAMRAVPVGVPKVMVSTQAAGNVGPYVGTKDIALFHSVADIEGINSLTETVLGNAARAMSGMVSDGPGFAETDEITVGITMFGVTTPCVKTARTWLEDRGYETVTFHATGTGGQAMEGLIEDGVIDAVLDVTTTEWADELVGGELGAGPDRLTAAGDVGIPQVVSTGALDMVNFGPADTVPERFRDRVLHEHNPQSTLMRTTAEENREIGRVIAEKLNAATGPTALVLPLEGISTLDEDGEPFHDPRADEALFDSLRRHVNDDVDVIEMETTINNEQFALKMAEKLDAYMRDSE